MSSNLKVNSLVPATGTEIGIGTTGGTIDFRCPATFGGNVTIGGTLTYDEVINIDSIGIVTARSGLKVTGGQLDVGSNIKLGNAGVITATSFVGSGAALTGIDATAIKDSGGNVKVQAQASGAVYTGIHTFNSDLDVDGHTNLDNVSISGVTTTGGNVNIAHGTGQAHYQITQTSGNTIKMGIVSGSDFEISGSSNNNIIFKRAGSTRLTVTSDGAVVTGILTATGAIKSGGDIDLDNGGSAGINFKRNGTLKSDIEIGSSSDQLAIRARGSSGFITFHTNTSTVERLRITSDGVLSWTSGSTPLSGTGNSYSINIYRDSGSGYGYLDCLTGSSNHTGWYMRAYHNGTYNKVIAHNTSDATWFETGGTERLRITSEGYVRIGGNEGNYPLVVIDESNRTTTADTQLHLYAKHDGSGTTGVGFGGGIRFWGDRASGNVEQNMGRIMCIADVNSGTTLSSAFTFETGVAGVLGEKVRINSAGGLKLSNTAGGHLFEYGGSSVNTVAAIDIYRLGNGYGDIRLSSNYGVSLHLAGASNNTDEYLITQDNVKNAYHNLKYDGFINFNTNNTTQAMRLQSGKVGINKNIETLTGNGVNAKLQVNTGSNDYDGIMLGGGYNRSTITTGGTYDLVLTSNAYPANATSKGIRFRCGTSGGGGPNERFRIHQDGILETRQHGTSKTYWFSSGQSGGYSSCTIVIDAHAYHSFIITVGHGGYAGAWGTARYLGYENGSMYYANEGTETTDSNSRNITHDQNPGGGHKHRIRITGGMGTHPGVELRITIAGPDAYIDTGDITYTWA